MGDDINATCNQRLYSQRFLFLEFILDLSVIPSKFLRICVKTDPEPQLDTDKRICIKNPQSQLIYVRCFFGYLIQYAECTSVADDNQLFLNILCSGLCQVEVYATK